MNPPVRHSSQIAKSATAIVAVVSALAAFLLATRLSTGARQPADTAPEPVKKAVVADPLAGLADVMTPSPDTAQSGELALRFRLAGTILGISNSGAEEPIAIIDDRVTVQQSIVTRGQTVAPGVILTQVKTASVILSGPSGEEEILLDKPIAVVESKKTPTENGDTKLDRATAAERFGGKEVFPNRWEFDRGALIAYYSELRDQPERLLTIFDSMDPVYQTDKDGVNSITGYEVGVEGEPDFFLAAGLSNGDIVRAVNSVQMSNRRRAESFIKNFVEGTLSTFVLEVERGGKTTKQVYLVD